MGRFAPVWTQQQRHVIAQAVLTSGMSAPAAARAAAAGELKPCPPFTIPVSSVHNIVRAARRTQDAEQRAQADPLDILREAIDIGARRALTEIKILDRSPKPADLERFARFVKLTGDLATQAQKLPATPEPKAARRPTTEPNLTDTLRKAHRTTRPNRTPNPQQTHATPRTPDTTTDHDTTTHTEPGATGT